MRKRREFWIISLFLAVATAASSGPPGQEKRSSEERDRTAAIELTRRDPRAFDAVHRALSGANKQTGSENVAANVAATLRRSNVELSLNASRLNIRQLRPMAISPTRIVGEELAAVDRLLRNRYSIDRRDDLIAEIKGTIPRTFDPLPAGSGESALERLFREDLHLRDYQAVAASFDTVEVKETTLTTETTLVRLYGGRSSLEGRFFTCCPWDPTTAPGSIQARASKWLSAWTDGRGLATPPSNLLDHLALVKVPAGTKVYVGAVADNFADALGKPLSGGGVQVFVPKGIQGFPFESYRRVLDGRASSQVIAVTSDGDRTFWFGRDE